MALNVLLIVVDCLRADHLSCYGYNKPTPNIDALAEKSVKYARAWSPGGCTSRSIPFILSEYLSTVLEKRGYALPTVVHSNPRVAEYLRRSPYFQGVDIGRASKLRRGLQIITKRTYNLEARAPALNRAAIKIMRSLAHPFFLCVWYMDVHNPFYPPGYRITDRGLNRRYLRAVRGKIRLTDREIQRVRELYDREIAYLDGHLNGLLDAVPEDTIIIFTADHGEEFGEDGDYGHHAKDIPALRWVPLFVRVPGRERGIRPGMDMKYLDRFIEGLICMQF
jgi:arylsulfatase